MHIRNKLFMRISASAAAAVLAVSAIPLKLSGSSAVQAADTTTISNPVIWSDVPDEDIIRVGDTYYMVSTTMFFSPGAPIMKSKDLVSWEICNYVYDTYADGDKQTLKNGENDYSHGQWAASLRYHDGNFYVFFGSYGTGKSYIYKTSDIENGTWTRSEINGMYHDASILFDDDGRNYLVYGAGGTAKIKEFNSDMTGFKEGGAEQTLFSTGLDNLAGEGWHIQKINGYYYIFVIAWPSNSKRIELCYRSKELLGTYEGKTVLNSGLGTYGGGVAQGGIVDTPDGKWYGMLFQDHGSVGRIPVLVPVTWKDNWPMMGVNGEAPLTIEVNSEYTGTQLARDDDFTYSSDDLALEWQWNHNPDNTAWSVTERPGYLRLKNNSLATNILDARNTLTQRTEGPSCSSVIKLDTSGMKTGDYAGLSAFQFKYGNVGIYVADDGTKKIYMANNGGYSDSAKVSDSYNNIVEQTNLTGNEIYLKIDFLFNTVDAAGNSSYNIDKANFYYSYNGADWTKIGEELSMVYSLTLFTGYRSGIYSYATKTTGGYADIDYFDYERADWNTPTVIEPNEYGWYFADGFEGDTCSWKTRGSSAIQTSGRTHYVGSEALLVQERAAAWNGAYKTLNPGAFIPGNEYSFSANVTYFDGAATDKFFLKLQYTDENGDIQYSTIAEGTAIRGEWVQLANTNYLIPADATDMQLYVETEETTNNFYIDEVIGAVGGTGILGAGEAKDIIPGDINFDGVLNVYDLCMAKRGLMNGFGSKAKEIAADVNQDETVDITDIQLIRDFLLVKITEFPVAEKPVETTITMEEYTAQAKDSSARIHLNHKYRKIGTAIKSQA
ncbi:MAG: family 43 glycosylhydrolase [Porcipelethomonas sp.]